MSILSNSPSESREDDFNQVEITIREPDVGHTWGYEFISDDKAHSRAYNIAILNLCRELGVFHQGGGGAREEHTPGWHYWEFLGQEMDVEQLQRMIPMIHAEAEKVFIRYIGWDD